VQLARATAAMATGVEKWIHMCGADGKA